MKRRITDYHLIAIQRKINRFKSSQDDLIHPDTKDNELFIEQIFKKKNILWANILAIIISMLIAFFVFLKTTQG